MKHLLWHPEFYEFFPCKLFHRILCWALYNTVVSSFLDFLYLYYLKNIKKKIFSILTTFNSDSSILTYIFGIIIKRYLSILLNFSTDSISYCIFSFFFTLNSRSWYGEHEAYVCVCVRESVCDFETLSFHVTRKQLIQFTKEMNSFWMIKHKDFLKAKKKSR